MSGARQLLTYAIVATFLLFFLSTGINYQVIGPLLKLYNGGGSYQVVLLPTQETLNPERLADHPDFSRFVTLRTLSANEFPIGMYHNHNHNHCLRHR